jgi:peptidyl-prolyl cis-trans isomerase C
MTVHIHPHAKPVPFQVPVVRLDGVEIPPAEIAAEIQHHPAASAEAAWHAAAEALVLKRLLLAEADRLGLHAAPEAEETPEEARIRGLLDAAIKLPEADEVTCRRWFEANPARFRTKEAWHAAHLLVAADPADAAARGAARARAETALAEVKADPGRLAVLAAAISDCPSREAAGDLGLVERGSTVAEFEAALRATEAGAVHGAVVESRYGFHVVRVLQHAEGRALPYEAVRDRIAAWLQEAAWRRAVRQYMALLAGRATVEGIVLSAGADGPLVQ